MCFICIYRERLFVVAPTQQMINKDNLVHKEHFHLVHEEAVELLDDDEALQKPSITSNVQDSLTDNTESSKSINLFATP